MTTTTKAKPIIFSAPMVRAILAGRKTRTMRVATEIKQFEGFCDEGNGYLGLIDYEGQAMGGLSLECRYGHRGDLLWVREAWCYHERVPISAQDGSGVSRRNICCRADYETDHGAAVEGADIRWRSPIHMPRWASRITLRITDVRVQRVQDISPEDAIAEGLSRVSGTIGGEHCFKYGLPGWPPERYRISPVDAFADLWDSINAKRGYPFSDNPWVWAITFEIEEDRT